MMDVAIHHFSLILRRWSLNSDPTDIGPNESPIWIRLLDVPLPPCTTTGIGRLASLVGRPVSKFVRIGTMVRVCLMMPDDLERVTNLQVSLEGHNFRVKIEFPDARLYVPADAKKPSKIWVPKITESAPEVGNAPQYSSKEKGTAKEGVNSEARQATTSYTEAPLRV
ncbi:hypothetical protein LINPERHAP1_LOCUS8744, partial [Linum perenne]